MSVPKRLKAIARARTSAGHSPKSGGGSRTTEKRYPSSIAVERAVDVLFLIAERNDATVTDLARAIGSSGSAVHRILTALKRKGLVEQRPDTERYALSWSMLALTRSLRERADLRTVSLSHMAGLRDLTEETVTLNVRSGFERVCIEQIESPHEVRWRSEIGRHSPIYAGATGKVLLTHFPPPERERYFSTVDRPRLSPYTTTDRHELERELERIRDRGYAIGIQDRVLGVAGVSAPIFDESGSAIAALTIAGPHPAARRTGSRAGPRRSLRRRRRSQCFSATSRPRHRGGNR